MNVVKNIFQAKKRREQFCSNIT